LALAGLVAFAAIRSAFAADLAVAAFGAVEPNNSFLRSITPMARHSADTMLIAMEM